MNPDTNKDVFSSVDDWLPVPSEHKNNRSEIKKVVLSTDLFEGLSPRDWKIISGLLHLRKFKKEEVVFEGGTPGLGMYIIIDGEVIIINRQENKDIELARLTKGAFLGELSLIDDINRSTTAIAARPTTLVGFFRPQLQQVIRQRPRLGVFLLERLAKSVFQRLRITNQKLNETRSLLAKGNDDAIS